MPSIANTPRSSAAISIQSIQAAWAWVFLSFFLLGLDQFLYFTGHGFVPKYYYFAWLGSGFLFLPGTNWRVFFRNRMVLWCLVYLVMALVWTPLADSQHWAVQELSYVITTLIFVLVSCAALPRILPETLRKILWVTVLVAVVSIIYDVLYPGTMLATTITETSTGNIFGRAAGFYMNPNNAGFSVLLIAICLVFLCSPVGSSWAMGIAFIGVVLTFSRGAISAWIIAMFFFTLTGRVPRYLSGVVIVAVAAFLVYGSNIIMFLDNKLEGNWSNSLGRIGFFISGKATDDSSASRVDVALSALDEFFQSPVLGRGLGYSQAWSSSGYGINTHNIYLKHALDFGLVGFLVYPLFLVAALYTRNGFHNKDALSVFIILFLLGFNSHNMMESAIFIITLCILNNTDFTKRYA